MVDARPPLVAWLAVLVIGALAQALLWSVSEPAYIFNDFYKAYYPVAEYLWYDGPSVPWPREEVGAGTFVNLPIVGWLFAPFVAFGQEGAGWVYLACGIAIAAAAWHLLWRRFAPAHGPLLLLLFLINGPMVNSLREGNSTHAILLLLIGGLLLVGAGRLFAAGVVFGICAVIKLPLMLIGVYYFVRGRWSVVAGGAAAIAGSALLSLLVHGLAVNIDWYRDSVEPFLGGVLPAFNVQSIDGFLIRLGTGLGGLEDWTPHRPVLLHKVVRQLIVAVLLGGSFYLMWRAGRQDDVPRFSRTETRGLTRRDIVEFCLVLILALVISPISWSHYYLLFLLPIALHVGGYTVVPSKGWRWALWIGFVLTSLPVVFVPPPAGWLGELAARSVISLWLVGALVMLAYHAHALWRLGDDEEPRRT